MSRLLAIFLWMVVAPPTYAGQPTMLQGVLAGYGTCKPFASNWAPQWANLRLLYHFEDAVGSTSCADSSGAGNPAACPGFASTKSKIGNGTVTGTGSYMYSSTTFNNPQTFSLSAWFRTSSTTGGAIMGFSAATTAVPTAGWDRQLYMAANGTVIGGIYDGNIRTVSSPSSYNDGNWHYTVLTYSSGNLILYMDGTSVATLTGIGAAQNYTGNWHVGYNYLSTWPSEPSTYNITGLIDDAAVFGSVLSSSDVSTIYSGGALTTGSPQWANLVALWRFNESSGVSIADSSGNGNTGVLTTATFGSTGKFGNALTAIGLAEADSTVLQTNPTTFTTSVWFKTTTTGGGGIFQFTAQQSGTPTSNYDRVAYMRNDGTITFGTYSGSIDTITTTASYNDGRWHYIAGVLVGGTTLKLYIDGNLLSTASTNQIAFDGYWRFGYAFYSGWPSPPTNANLPGILDEAAVWNAELTAAQIKDIYYKQSCGKN